MPKYASFTSRMLACSVDLCLVMLVALPVTQWLAGQMFEPVNVGSLMTMSQGTPDPHMLEQVWAKSLLQFVVMNLLQVAFIALYTLPFWFHYSTTPGKMLFRMEIRDAMSGDRMTRSQSVRRFLGYIVSSLPLTLGFFWVLFSRRKQGWHDLIAGTVVVVKSKQKTSA